MIKEPRVLLFDMVMCLSNVMDMVSPELVGHQKRVAYIALSIAVELGLSIADQNNLLLAGLLHDSAAISLKERLDTLEFETEKPCKHAELGFLLLKKFQPFFQGALIVKYHHVSWSENNGQVPIGSHILHLADRVDVLIDKQHEILGQVKRICERIEEHAGRMFAPQLVDVFKRLAAKEYFWLDIVRSSITSVLALRSRLGTLELDLEKLTSLAELFSQMVDFRSRFTAAHSSGVAASGEVLARLAGLSERECRMMRIAGYLHDLGKLAIPTDILEKPAKLTEDEFDVMRSHSFYTYLLLEPIDDLYLINTWASFHHERLDGTGYPFHHKGENLSLGSRIMAVADVFTAITEDRPYRKGMEASNTLSILQEMVENSALDPNVTSLLRMHFDEVNAIRMIAQSEASRDYQEFVGLLG